MRSGEVASLTSRRPISGSAKRNSNHTGMLGYHEGTELIDTAGIPEGGNQTMETVFLQLRHAWYPPSSATARSFTRHTEKLTEIFDRLRREDDLAFLDHNLYFNLDEWRATGQVSAPSPPAIQTNEVNSDQQFRAGFYICSSMIQLMENVYLRFSIWDQYWDHPDNRGLDESVSTLGLDADPSQDVGGQRRLIRRAVPEFLQASAYLGPGTGVHRGI